MAKQVRNQKLLNAIGIRIKYFREAKGITQEVVVNDTGINIGRIENGQTNISLSTLEVICAYLGITIEDFFAEGFGRKF